VVTLPVARPPDALALPAPAPGRPAPPGSRGGPEVAGRALPGRSFADTGVDRIAVGALTHSAPALDLERDVDGF